MESSSSRRWPDLARSTVGQCTTGCDATRVARGGDLVYRDLMADDRHDRDVLAWSQRQAEPLRRLSRGERVNHVDRRHVVEQIEDVGRSELNAVQSYLELILRHVLKTRAWPASDLVGHGRAEILGFQGNAEQRFTPSMTQRIDLAKLYRRAIRQVATRDGGELLPGRPASCPFTLDALLRHEDGLPRHEDGLPRHDGTDLEVVLASAIADGDN